MGINTEAKPKLWPKAQYYKKGTEKERNVPFPVFFLAFELLLPPLFAPDKCLFVS